MIEAASILCGLLIVGQIAFWIWFFWHERQREREHRARNRYWYGE